MLRRIITGEIAAFMVELIEMASAEFYENDRALAFKDLNDKLIWHHFIEKFEEKRNLPLPAIADEISQLLGKEKSSPGAISPLDNDATAFILTVIRKLAQKYNWNYSVTFEKFYYSNACARGGLSTRSIEEILELFDREITK